MVLNLSALDIIRDLDLNYHNWVLYMFYEICNFVFKLKNKF